MSSRNSLFIIKAFWRLLLCFSCFVSLLVLSANLTLQTVLVKEVYSVAAFAFLTCVFYDIIKDNSKYYKELFEEKAVVWFITDSQIFPQSVSREEIDSFRAKWLDEKYGGENPFDLSGVFKYALILCFCIINWAYVTKMVSPYTAMVSVILIVLFLTFFKIFTICQYIHYVINIESE